MGWAIRCFVWLSKPRNPGVRPGVGVVSCSGGVIKAMSQHGSHDISRSFPRYGRCEVSRYSFTGSKLGEGVVYFLDG